MSQAVSAPITGARSFTGGKSVKATDISTGIVGQESPSRRAVLTGMMLAPAVVACSSTASATPDFSDPMLLSRRIDSAFWAQRDIWLSIKSDWRAADAAGYLTDEENDTFCKRLDAAEYSMVTCRILTLSALYAKMEAIREEPQNLLRHKDDPTMMFDAIMWDVEHLIMKAGRT